MKTARIDFDNEQYDDAVSRSYYAVYHAMTAALLFKDEVYSSHARTIGAFNRIYIKSGIFPKNFTRIIHDLFQDRQLGDYDVDMIFEHKVAKNNIKKAENILKSVEEYLIEAGEF
ncbi:MAG: HEPN domain-containing protein [Bacteroidetes bacterium]|nr:MAG: HEPN domain-containing protein [Bacteroidota bacterium]